MIIRYFKDYIESINEGLIKTYPSNIISNELTHSLIYLDLNFNVEFSEDKIHLTFYYFNAIPIQRLDYLFDNINTFVINRGGWFPSQMNITNIHKMRKSNKYDVRDLYLNHSQYDIVEIIYECKFDSIVENIPNKLYHLSISEYTNKILKYGLVPKSKDKLTTHLDRIYLCESLDDCRDLISSMSLYYDEEKSFNKYNKNKRKFDRKTIPVIFEIDNSDQFIEKLYNDPNYDKGFYTLSNIPNDKISIVDINI